MERFSELLYANGGGIIPEKHRARHSKNTVDILIGLGGTGIDCVKKIKAMVSEEIEAEALERSRIQFLGVDSDRHSFLRNLEKSEIFELADPFAKFKKPGMCRLYPELAWMSMENTAVGMGFPGGSTGFRQAGRYLFMEQSEKFRERLEDMIRNAMSGLERPEIYIHIFTGLCGGTGSGIFPDVCYVTKELLKQMNVRHEIVGYCFLPDVNLAKIPEENRKMREYQICNGYAAMQELDYCMRIGENGGLFIQKYKGGRKIAWDSAPFTICHLISGESEENTIVSDPYEYALNLTSEYVMQILTEISGGNTLRAMLRSRRTIIAEVKQDAAAGTAPEYITIGFSGAKLPSRELNTLLAGEILEQMRKTRQRELTPEDMQKFLYNVGLGDLGMLWRELEEENTSSLKERILSEVLSCIKDFDFGIFAVGQMFEKSKEYSLSRIFEKLLAENESHWEQEKIQLCYAEDQYAAARETYFGKKNVLFAKRYYEDYIYREKEVEQRKYRLAYLEETGKVLAATKSWVESSLADLCRKVLKTTENLMDVFCENRMVLQHFTAAGAGQDSPVMMLLDRNDLKENIDRGLDRLPIPSIYNQLMQLLIEELSDGQPADEDRTMKKMKEFFTYLSECAFGERTMPEVLQDKFDGMTAQQDYFQNDLLPELLSRAELMFPTEPQVWTSNGKGEAVFAIVPYSADPARRAVNQLWNGGSTLYNGKMISCGEKVSTNHDRISIVHISGAVPLCAYKKCREYEQIYFSKMQPGCHIYEGKENRLFDDWTHLPSLIPESCTDYENIPEKLKELLAESRTVLQQAIAYGLLQEDTVCVFEEQGKNELRAAIEKAEYLIQNCKPERAETAMNLRQAADRIERALECLEVKKSGYVLQNTYFGQEDKAKRIRKRWDYFVSAPVVRKILKEEIRAAEEAKKMQERLQEILDGMTKDNC